MINELTVERRALGVSFRADVAEVLIWAPACKRAALQIGDREPLPLIPKTIWLLVLIYARTSPRNALPF
jgi:hypothetical protein